MRDKGLSGTCRAALFHALLPVVPPLSGSVPEQGDSQEGGGGRIPSAAPFSPAAPRCASSGGSLRSDASSPSLHARRRSVLSPHISRCENLPSAARTNIARGRPVPNTGLDAPAAGLRRPLTALFRPRKDEPPRRRDRKSGAFPAFVRFVPRRKGRHALLLRRASGGAKGCGSGSGRCETGPFLLRGGRYNSTP